MLTACRSKKDRKDSQPALSRIIIAREGHGLTLVGAPAATEFATSIKIGEVARQLHTAYRNPAAANAHIAEAIEILDLVQADI